LLFGFPAAVIDPRSTTAFALVIVSTVAALALREVLGYISPGIPPFATFFASILGTAILAGYAAGIATAALGLAAAWWAFAGSVPAAFTSTGLALYILTSLAIVWISGQYRTFLRKLQDKEAASKRQLALTAAENSALAQIASEAPLSDTLDKLARSVEAYSQGSMQASILLLDADGERLRHGAAPSLPSAYTQAIDGQPIGPAAGSCGTAAFRNQPVYVTDIDRDPLWASYRELALTHGLKACWSTPIPSKTNSVLGTFALYHHEPRPPTLYEKEIVGLLTRIAALAIEQDRELRQRQVLLHELAHRVKNTLAVVHSIASSTLRSHTDTHYYKTFEDRLIALSKAQDLLTQASWSTVDLHELITAVAIAPFATDPARFRFEGPRTRLPARLAAPFALSLHELCTNASKYGALTRDDGRILIEWGYAGGENAERKFYFRWAEIGGPAVQQPSRRGFGTRMITEAFSSEFGGTANIDYRPHGLVCEICLSAEKLSSADRRN
jgi:two-component sensor histidine kinase